MKVIVVDDYAAWRYFVRSAVKQHTPTSFISEAADGLEAVRTAAELQPDLVTLDIGLPRLNGIEAARQIREKSPRTKVLFVTQEQSPEIAQEALAAGGRGYVVKSDGKETLLKAVDAIMCGGRYISRTVEVSDERSGALGLVGNPVN
jgi:DNA-binding NarL/FixJ family response regulator